MGNAKQAHNQAKWISKTVCGLQNCSNQSDQWQNPEILRIENRLSGMRDAKLFCALNVG